MTPPDRRPDGDPDRRPDPRPGRLAAAAAAVRSLPQRTPLRLTLVAMVLVLVALALAGTGFAGTFFLRKYLVDRVSDQLAAPMRGAALNGGAPPPFRPPGVGAARIQRPMDRTGFYLQYFDRTGASIDNPGNALAIPDGVDQTGPDLTFLSPAAVRAHGDRPFTVKPVGTGYQWLVRVAPLADGDGSVAVGTSLNEVDSAVGQLAMYETLIGAVALLLVGIIGYILVRRSLRRLVEVEHTAAAIARGDLTRRVPPGDPRTEVGRLVVALNAMLGQIERAFMAQQVSEAQSRASEERMRRFVADASHELRTPLTAIRGFAELARRRSAVAAGSGGAGGAGDLGGAGGLGGLGGPASLGDLDGSGGAGEPGGPIGFGDDTVVHRIEQHATRMGLLVDDLLLLARLDQQRPLERRPVDLLDLAGEAIMDAAVTAPDHPVRLRATSQSDAAPPVVLGDQARLRQVLGNLLSNAFLHTPSGTPVGVGVTIDGDRVILAVADEGPGIAPDDAARVFERFYRTDPSRTRAHGGSGLGLSIVAAIVAAHGGTVDLRTAPGAGTHFEVRLPLYDPS